MSARVPGAAATWPSRFRAAAALTFDLDAESAALSTSWGLAERPGVMSHQSYGPLVGVPRILDVLDRHGVPATFFVPGYTAELYPGVVRDVVAAGHEVAHHGYLHEPLAGATTAQEESYLDRGLEALESAAGVRPTGYRAPMWETTWETPRLLADRGFVYDSSLMDADHPYRLAVTGSEKASDIVEVPIHWGLDDWEQYCFIPGVTDGSYIAAPSKALDMWSGELDALRQVGGCFTLTSHPFLSGRPGRARVLDQLLEQAVAYGDVWVTSLGRIAAHTAETASDVRSSDPPPAPRLQA